MVKNINVSQILEQATNLDEKIKDQEEIKQENLINWISETNDMILKLGKALDKLEERFELLEEIMEK